MHPNKLEASDALNSKMRRMTMHYGDASGPDKNRLAAVENLKGNGPESHVGFGADYAAANSRSDKPARKSVSANPIATYKRGGKASGGDIQMDYAKDVANNAASGKSVPRARGGKVHRGKGSTHVNVIVSPHGSAPPAGPTNPMLAGAAMPHPPMAPPPGGPPPAMPGPPMGGPPMGAPPTGAPMMRKRGGKVHSDEKQDKALIKKELKDEGLIRKAKGGSIIGDEGKVPSVPMEGGSVSGPGREDKNKHFAKHGNMKKQDV